MAGPSLLKGAVALLFRCEGRSATVAEDDGSPRGHGRAVDQRAGWGDVGLFYAGLVDLVAHRGFPLVEAAGGASTLAFTPATLHGSGVSDATCSPARAGHRCHRSPDVHGHLDNLVVTNALPLMYVELGASVEQLQWFINAYTLAFAAAILLAVALGDRYGRRTVFAAGIAVFTLGSALAGLSTSPIGVIAARVVQGFGAAALLPLSLALLVGSVPSQRRALAIGIWGGVSGLGVAAGPLVGGVILQQSSWPTVFWLNVPIGVVALPLVLRWLPNPTGARLPLDLAGVALAGLGTLGIVLGIVSGNAAGWSKRHSSRDHHRRHGPHHRVPRARTKNYRAVASPAPVPGP